MRGERLLLGARLTALAACFLGLALLLWYTDRPAYRYRDFACIYDQIYGQEGPVEMAGTGGSRFLNGFGAEELAALYAEAGEPEAVVYNLGHARRGPDFEYVVIRDLVERRAVRHVVILVDKQVPTYRRNPDYYQVARKSDLFELVAANRDEDPLLGVSKVLRLMVEQLNSWGSAAKREASEPEPARTSTCFPGDMPLRVDRLTGEVPAEEVEFKRDLDLDPEDPDVAYLLYFLRLLAELEARRPVNVFFVNLPPRGGRTFAAGYRERFAELTGSDKLLVIPDEVLARLADGGYRDSFHVYAPGRQIFVDWLFDAIREHCGQAGACA